MALPCSGCPEQPSSNHKWFVFVLFQNSGAQAPVVPPFVHVHDCENQCILCQTHKKEGYFNWHWLISAEGVDAGSWLVEICCAVNEWSWEPQSPPQDVVLELMGWNPWGEREESTLEAQGSLRADRAPLLRGLCPLVFLVSLPCPIKRRMINDSFYFPWSVWGINALRVECLMTTE